MFTCPVCGYDRLVEPPRTKCGGSWEICPSCGFQFGVSDEDEDYTDEQWRDNHLDGNRRRSSSESGSTWERGRELKDRYDSAWRDLRRRQRSFAVVLLRPPLFVGLAAQLGRWMKVTNGAPTWLLPFCVTIVWPRLWFGSVKWALGFRCPRCAEWFAFSMALRGRKHCRACALPKWAPGGPPGGIMRTDALVKAGRASAAPAALRGRLHPARSAQRFRRASPPPACAYARAARARALQWSPRPPA